MKRLFPLLLAVLFLASCQSEEEKKDEELRQKIDSSVKLSGNEFGQMKLIIRGGLLDTAMTFEGNKSFEATYDAGSDLVVGKMAANDGSVSLDYGFEGTELGYRSLDGEKNFATIDFKIDTLSFQNADFGKAKVAVRRVSPGGFAVGSYTGVVNLDGKSHTFRVEFETTLKEKQPVQ